MCFRTACATEYNDDDNPEDLTTNAVNKVGNGVAILAHFYKMT
jgi:hypothetical protein